MELCYRNNQKSLFRKYAHLATWVGKTMVDKDIVLYLPNGYIKRVDRNTYQMRVSTRPIHTNALYPALLAINTLQYRLENFKEATHVMWWYLNGGRMPSLLRRFHFDSSTFNPDANPETASVDGQAGRDGVNETFATIRAGAGNAAQDASTTDTLTQFASTATTDQYGTIARGIFLYDTSSLPDDVTIDSATHEIYVNSKSDNFNHGLVFTTSNPASNTAIANSDYANVGSVENASNRLDITDVTTGAYNAHTLNATGINNINKTGISKFGIRGVADFDNAAPTWVSSISANATIDFADGTNDPKLTVNFTPDTGGIFLQ